MDGASFDWHEAGLTIGQVAQRSGVASSALRFYERQGLITSDRTGGNQRRYRGDVLCRVAMIRACQRVGLSITDIRIALAELPEGHVPGPGDWDRLAHRLRHELRGRIADLNRALNALSQHDLEPSSADRVPALPASSTVSQTETDSAHGDYPAPSAELVAKAADVRVERPA